MILNAREDKHILYLFGEPFSLWFLLYLAERYYCILLILRIENSKAFDFEIGIFEKKTMGVEGFLNVQIAFKTVTHYL